MEVSRTVRYRLHPGRARKKSATARHRRSLPVRLEPHGGETQGRVRFGIKPDFRHYSLCHVFTVMRRDDGTTK